MRKRTETFREGNTEADSAPAGSAPVALAWLTLEATTDADRANVFSYVPPIATAALLLFQTAVSDVVLDAPPDEGFVEYSSGDGATIADLYRGDLPDGHGLADVHFRAWARGTESLVIVGSRMDTVAALRGFVDGATDSANEHGERLEEFPGLPEVRRFAREVGTARLETAVFTKDIYGFLIMANGPDAERILEHTVRAQLARTPDDPPPQTPPVSAYDVGWMEGRILEWVLLAGGAIWLLQRSRRGRRSPPDLPGAGSAGEAS